MPIVEPEVLMDGDHSIERCYEVTTRHAAHRLRPAVRRSASSSKACCSSRTWCIPGKKYSGGKATPEQIADATIRVLPHTVPAAVPGIVFLSGGQGDEEATANLDAINKKGPLPWQVSFSYGRALQAAALSAWQGEDANAARARRRTCTAPR